MKAVLDINESQAPFMMELLRNFSFVKIQSFENGENLFLQEKKERVIFQEKEVKTDFFKKCFGMWEDRNIDAENLRKQAWGIE